MDGVLASANGLIWDEKYGILVAYRTGVCSIKDGNIISLENQLKICYGPSSWCRDGNGDIYLVRGHQIFQFQENRLEELLIDNLPTTDFGIAADKAGNLYLSSYSPDLQFGVIDKKSRIFKELKLNGELMSDPRHFVITQDGNMILPDFNHQVIYQLSLKDGKVSTLAGRKHERMPDARKDRLKYQDGIASEAVFETPISVALDSKGDIYVSEYHGNRLRKICHLIWSPTTHALFPLRVKQVEISLENYYI